VGVDVDEAGQQHKIAEIFDRNIIRELGQGLDRSDAVGIDDNHSVLFAVGRDDAA
jgi:hypothetical protein